MDTEWAEVQSGVEYIPDLAYLLKLSIDERNKEYKEAEPVFQIFTKHWLEMRLN